MALNDCEVGLGAIVSQSVEAALPVHDRVFRNPTRSASRPDRAKPHPGPSAPRDILLCSCKSQLGRLEAKIKTEVESGLGVYGGAVSNLC
jgi:hypothetical protein